jgi:hypothetical protein
MRKVYIKAALFVLSFLCFSSEGMLPAEGLPPPEAARRIVVKFGGRDAFDALKAPLALMQRDRMIVLDGFNENQQKLVESALEEVAGNPVGGELLKLCYAHMKNAQSDPKARDEEKTIVLNLSSNETGVLPALIPNSSPRWGTIGVNFDRIDNKGVYDRTQTLFVGVKYNLDFAIIPRRLSDTLFHELLHWLRHCSGMTRAKDVSLYGQPTDLIKRLNAGDSHFFLLSAFNNDEELSTITGIYEDEKRDEDGKKELKRWCLSENEFNRSKAAPYNEFLSASHLGLSPKLHMDLLDYLGSRDKLEIVDITQYLKDKNHTIRQAWFEGNGAGKLYFLMFNAPVEPILPEE